MIWRPCGDCSCMRSASVLETIAVDDIASVPPMTMPTRQSRPAYGDLRAADTQHQAAHRGELRQAELEAHREHEEHHAEFREVAAIFRVGDETERVRPDQRPDHQVAEDRGQVEQAEYDDHCDRGSEQDQRDGERVGHVRSANKVEQITFRSPNKLGTVTF